MSDSPKLETPAPAASTAALSPEHLDALAKLVPGLLYAAEQDLWVRPEADGTIRVGATHLVAAHGQFMLFTPRPVGTEVKRDQSLGVMETAKTAVAIHAPVSARVLEFNAAATADVTLVERDPYGAGWLFRLQPTAMETERDALLDLDSYAAWLGPRLAQRATAPIGEVGDDPMGNPGLGY